MFYLKDTPTKKKYPLKTEFGKLISPASKMHCIVFEGEKNPVFPYKSTLNFQLSFCVLEYGIVNICSTCIPTHVMSAAKVMLV